MEEKFTIKSIDTSELTPEIVKQMANDLFSSTRSDFDEIKNRTWYKKLLNAVTLGVNDRKMTIKNVRSLANLQTLFLNLYTSQEISHDAELDEIVMSVQYLQESVISLHKKCVLQLTNIQGPEDISREDQQILLWFLTLINQDNMLPKEQCERYKNYNYAIKSCCNKVIQAEEKPNFDMLKNVEFPKVFYRCAAEQAVYTFGEISFNDIMVNALKKLSISEEDKEMINNAVRQEVGNFTLDVLMQKYAFIEGEGDFDGFETEVILTESIPPENESSGADEAGFVKIIECVQIAIDTGKLGKSLIKKSGDAEKEIVKLLPGIQTKTVVAITKVKNGNLVFTTFAVYYIQKECVKQINYAEISEDKISIDFKTGAFSFRGSDGQKIIISDERIDAKAMLKLMCELQNISKFPNSDIATSIKEMSEKIRTAYLRLIYYVVTASKCEDYEIYKKTNEYGITKNWEVIKNGINDDQQFEAELEYWKNSVQYPSEETAEVSMIIDICQILQFTRNSDDIPATSEKYFEKICQFEKEKEENIINFALSEKKAIEQRITFEAYKKVLEGFAVSLGGVGISILACSPIWTTFLAVSWFNLIPGVGALISIGIVGGSAIKNVIDQKKNKKFNAEELRIRLFKDQFENYERAIRDAKSKQYLNTVSDLKKAKDLLCKNANLEYSVKVVEDDRIYEKIKEKIIKCIGNCETCGRLISNLSDKEKRKLLKDMVVPGITEKIEDTIAYYNIKIFAVLTGSCSGILFVKKGIYYKESSSSHVMYIPYVEMKSVIENLQYLEIITKDNRVIKCKGSMFSSNGLPQLFNEIVHLLA